MNETINTVMTEGAAEAVAQVAEAIPVKSIDWSKLGKAGAVVGVVAGIGAGAVAVFRHVKRKKQEKAEQAATAGETVDNVKVAEADFVEKDSEDK